MLYSVIDTFNQTLGASYKTIEAAEDAIEELGEAAGEMSVVEVTTSLDDGADASGEGGQRWNYDSITEKLVKA